MEQWLGQVASALLVGALTGAMTVRLGLQRFRHERWWEKRYEAYAALIGCIGEIHIVLSNERAKAHVPGNAEPSRLGELPELARKIMRLHYLSGLLMSREMSDLVREYAPKLVSARDLETALDTTNAVIVRANELARRDLSLPKF